MSHEDAEAQLQDVEKILRQLGIDPQSTADDKRTLIEVWNKIDRLDAEQRARLANIAERRPEPERPVLVSAITGEGIDVARRRASKRGSAPAASSSNSRSIPPMAPARAGSTATPK